MDPYAEVVSGILIVDDDRTVGGILLSYLERAQLVGRHLDSAAQLTDVIAAMDPDLIVLDVMLPDADGVELCAQVRQTNPGVPIILLTAKSQEVDRIAGLTAGADDYVVKPFSPRELVLRIQSVLRRAAATPRMNDPGDPLVDGDLVIDLRSRQARKSDVELPLTGREFDLLAYFIKHTGAALTRDDLLRDVWEWDYGDQSTVTVHVRRLREKVEHDPAKPSRLVTVWGVGYRWDSATEVS